MSELGTCKAWHGRPGNIETNGRYPHEREESCKDWAAWDGKADPLGFCDVSRRDHPNGPYVPHASDGRCVNWRAMTTPPNPVVAP